jgi:membrane fusion protein (multidrug efflux system)
MIQPKRRPAAQFLLLLLLVACDKADKKAPPPPPPVVKVAEAVSRDVPIFVEAIGQTRGNIEIDISARVEGFLETMDFKQGSYVKKGQRLYTIDSRPYRAAIAQAKATLAQSEAELTRTHQDVVRYEPLVAKNAVSVQDLETAKANENAQKSAVAAARAVLERSQVELGYTTVTAPDDGLIGTTEAFPGSLVGRGATTLLTRISKVDPIHVRFSISESDYLFYARRQEAKEAAAGKGGTGGKGGTSKGGPPGASAKETEFQLLLADGSIHPYPGSLVFIDRNVDAKTGTIRLEAAFPNPGGLIRPGQYARVRASVSTKPGAVLVPQGSLVEVQGISNVAVVKADDTIEVRPVKPADRIGGLVILDSGLKVGERIVVEGMQKVRPGIKVQPQLVPLESAAAPSATPGAAPSAAPSPSASGG